MGTVLVIALSVLAAVVIVLGCRTSRGGYDTTPYELVRSVGKFELRDYPVLTVVETSMSGIGSHADDRSFSRLFGFITGRNEATQKIPMTTPVFMTELDSNRTMAFVMPAKLNSGQVPRPVDGSVTVRELAAGRFAVLRFSGGRNLKYEAEALDRLRTWMAAEGLSESSSAVYGYFEPPWTPGPLRRNEVMLRTEAGQE
jgi:DNA gyrase inhibitor GyrI